MNGVQNLTPIVRAQLEERWLHLNVYWDEYDEIQSRIEAIETSKNRVIDRTSKKSFNSLCAKIRHLHSEDSSFRARSSPSISAEDSVESLSHVCLPRLNLPTFSSKYDEWFSFHDTFTDVMLYITTNRCAARRNSNICERR